MKSFSKLFLLSAASLTALSALGLSSCDTKTTAVAQPALAQPTLAQSELAQTELAQPALAQPVKAKNVILFIGDGMGISTITAARIFDGQSKGMNGEGNRLSFEEFQNLALVKTYNLDAQVADSAGTASAMNTGMKTQIGKINVQPDGLYAGCADSTATPPTLFADLAENAGMSTGIVSTARLTHATPAAVYGHAQSRGWEIDSEISKDGQEKGCIDLAAQLVAYGGKGANAGLEVALGGGQGAFFGKDEGGMRKDGQNLAIKWAKKSNAHSYVDTVSDLNAIDAATGQNVLGLFGKSHMSYEVDRDKGVQPSLTEMTRFAIDNLAARDTGYFLMVEAGRIDHAHHATNAYRALSETQELARAVALADEMTSDEDTLILVTADHSHVFTIAGYPKAGNPILGLVVSPESEDGKPSLAGDKLPYTTLGYHNGPHIRDDVEQTDNMVQDKDYKQQTAIKRASETHGGEDVALFAKGPGAEQVHGIIDQAEIFDIMGKAVGVVD